MPNPHKTRGIRRLDAKNQYTTAEILKRANFVTDMLERPEPEWEFSARYMRLIQGYDVALKAYQFAERIWRDCVHHGIRTLDSIVVFSRLRDAAWDHKIECIVAIMYHDQMLDLEDRFNADWSEPDHLLTLKDFTGLVDFLEPEELDQCMEKYVSLSPKA